MCIPWNTATKAVEEWLAGLSQRQLRSAGAHWGSASFRYIIWC